MITSDDQKLVDAIATTTMREGDNFGHGGGLWCPPAIGQKLRLAIPRRDKTLYGLLQQAVRLIRLMDRADAGGYQGFLYISIPWLRTAVFSRFIGRALAAGRLAGVARADGQTGVIFEEAEMNAASGAPFSLSFAQMPTIAALIDILHNMLGYDRLKSVCSDVCGPICARTAAEVAKDLRKHVEDWLRPCLASEHLAKQAEVIRKYLEAIEKTDPNLIDDDVVFSFWSDRGAEAEIDGFRNFRNAARKMLTYRTDILIARREYMAESAGELQEYDASTDISGNSEQVWESSQWISPLHLLLSPPCDRIKWMVGTELKLAGHLVSNAADTPDGDAIDGSGVVQALFSNDAPDPTFYRSLMRFSYFGARQALVSRGYKANAPKRPEHFADYGQLFGRFVAMETKLLAAVRTGAAILLRNAHVNALPLCAYAAPEMVRSAFRDIAPDAIDELEIGGSIQQGFVTRLLNARDEAGRDIFAVLSPLERGRTGFKEAEERDPDIVEGLAEGVDGIERLHRCIADYVAWMSRQDLSALFEQDNALFETRFAALYAE